MDTWCRVLVVDHDRYFYGSQQYLFRLAPGLERHGVEVTLAGPAAGELGRVWRESGRPFVPLETPRRRVLVTDSGRPSPARVVRELYRVLRGSWRTARLARQVGADVIVANSYGWAFNEVVLAARLLRRRSVVYLHMQVEPGPVRLARAAAIRTASATVGVSTSVVASLPARTAARVTVVHTGIDADRFSPGPGDPAVRAELTDDPTAAVILVIARLVPAKGVDDVIRAVASLPAHLAHTRLAIAGEAFDPGYQRMLRDLGERCLPGRVRFLGNRTDVAGLLRAVDVFVLASDGESLGLCVLEAQACGTPAVAYPAGGVTELIDHDITGLLARQGDVEDLGRQLARLLSDPALAEKLATTARDRIVHLRSLGQQADAHAAVLRRLAPTARQRNNP